MKIALLPCFLLLFLHQAMAWGPDVIPAPMSPPAGKPAIIAKDVNNLFAVIPTTANASYSVLVFQSTDGGTTWNPAPFTGAGPGGGVVPKKVKAIQTFTDSVYAFYLIGVNIYSTNLETGFTNIFTQDPAEDFDVTASTVTNSIYLFLQDQGLDDIHRYGSTDAGITWTGNTALVTGTGLRPVVTMHGSRLILNYYGTIQPDTSKSIIRGSFYNETSAGQLAVSASNFQDLATNINAQKRLYQSVIMGNTVWFFYTEINANGEQLFCRTSGDGGVNYATAFNLNPNPLTESIISFDATINDGPQSGCDIYYFMQTNGGTEMHLMLRSALTIGIGNFSSAVQVSNHSAAPADPRHVKPCAVRLPFNTEHAAGWIGNMPSNDTLYFDRESFIMGINDAIKTTSFLNLYPNPVRDDLFLRCEEKNQRCVVKLFAAGGQLIQSVNVLQEEHLIHLDVRKLHPGNYVLQAEFRNGKSYTGKFTVPE